jgi:transposase
MPDRTLLEHTLQRRRTSAQACRGWDAGRGDDCKDTPGVFRAGQADQGDLPGVGRIAQGGQEGDSVWATEFRYQREDQPLPKMGRWRDTLDRLLSQNEAKSSRERLTLIRLFEELRERGYDGGYDAVRRYARRWAQERGQATAAAFVPLSFAPGEAYQFDRSHEIVLLSGATVTVKVAHVRLCHSRMLFVRAYPRETQEMVFDAHDRAFALFKGTSGR